MASAHQSEAYTQSSSRKKTSLPSGWIKRESRRHRGKFYYFNENTGESSWTLPKDSCVVCITDAWLLIFLFFYRSIKKLGS